MDPLESTGAIAAVLGRKPTDDEIDIHGLTHAGKVRPTNQDHFLLCSLHKQMVVHDTSLPDLQEGSGTSERLASLAMVADGVGGGAKGEEASRVVLQTVSEYVADAMNCYYTNDGTDRERFTETLHDAAMRCHQQVLKRAEGETKQRGMATTLTLFIGVWPWIYLLQVGDSRYYLYDNGTLTQITRDQTMAQELLDQGVLTRSDAFNSRWAHVLSSSLGGSQTAPVVTRIQSGWDRPGLLCSDGLTRHLSDERIKEHLASMTSAKQVCEDLLQEALDGGGSDNITIVVGRAVKKHD